MKRFLLRLKVWLFRLYYRIVNRRAWKGHIQPGSPAIRALSIPTSHGQIGARLYQGDDHSPLIVYYHGGGWVIGDLDTHDPFCRSLTATTGCSVVSVDYRMAPESPFPAAHNDCLEATRWILDNLSSLTPNNGTLVLAGDSAGGNLTACTVASLAGEERIVGAIMIYPVTEHYLAGLASYQEQANTGPLTTPVMHWFFDTYLGDVTPEAAEADTLFVSRRTDYRDFPRSLLVTAERDPLKDDGALLHSKMAQAGVDITYHHYLDEAHGFACSEGPTEGHRHFIELTREWLKPLQRPPR